MTRENRSAMLSVVTACVVLRLVCGCGWLLAASLPPGEARESTAPILVPDIDGEWWPIAGETDLGPYTTPAQQPVDFGIWQAADSTWQLWSCIRNTSHPGRKRLFHRWEGANLTDKNWRAMGIAMTADLKAGETEGGLQAPYVRKFGDEFVMVYGDFEHICIARSTDGKSFTRQVDADGHTGMFTEGIGANTRDPMLLRIGELFYLYYTAHPNRLGADYLRTSTDARHWSAPTKVASGGSAGTGPLSAECPFVYYHEPSGACYLFRTQVYGRDARSSVYRSRDPASFGVDNDEYLVGTMPYAAIEIVEHAGQTYIAALLPTLKGIQIAKLKWVRPAQ